MRVQLMSSIYAVQGTKIKSQFITYRNLKTATKICALVEMKLAFELEVIMKWCIMLSLKCSHPISSLLAFECNIPGHSNSSVERPFGSLLFALPFCKHWNRVP